MRPRWQKQEGFFARPGFGRTQNHVVFVFRPRTIVVSQTLDSYRGMLTNRLLPGLRAEYRLRVSDPH